MKRIASLIIFIVFMLSFCGCNKEEVITYDLSLISPAFEKIYSHYSPQESENEKYIMASSTDYEKYLTRESLPLIDSLTICDENITKETSQNITDLCKQYNIPVFFLMNDVEKEVIESYDKAFCISADYTYIGEIFADKIYSCWEDTIIDKNGDRIFSFSVIKPETFNNMQEKFYESLIKNIELLGIPLQQLDEIYLSRGDVYNYCAENKTVNEAFIILESSYLSVFSSYYEPHREGIEVLGIEFDVENTYTEYPFMMLCFIDYTQYFEARDAVMANIAAKVYPFKNLEYSIIDKNIYIQPTI